LIEIARRKLRTILKSVIERLAGSAVRCLGFFSVGHLGFLVAGSLICHRPEYSSTRRSFWLDGNFNTISSISETRYAVPRGFKEAFLRDWGATNLKNRQGDSAAALSGVSTAVMLGMARAFGKNDGGSDGSRRRCRLFGEPV
jgi:phosphate transport system permease protein